METRKGSQSGMSKKPIGELGDGNRCGTCKKGVGGKDVGVQCEICANWYHCTCQDVEDELYEVLNKYSKDISWFCKSCKGGASKMLELIASMQKKLNQFQSLREKDLINVDKIKEDYKKESEDMKKCIQLNIDTFKKQGIDIRDELKEDCRNALDEIKKSFQSDITGLRQDTSELRKELKEAKLKIECEESSKALIMDGQWPELVEREVDNKIAKKIEDFKEAIQEERDKAEELRQKELRRRNVIIYNIPEEESISDQNKKDEKFVCEMFGHIINDEFSPKEMNRIFRLGRKEGQHPEGWVGRPILVEFSEGVTKNLIMNGLVSLKRLLRYRNIIINHDMTLNERGECRRLVAEAKKMEEELKGEWICRVRGVPGQMKIVKWKKH